MPLGIAMEHQTDETTVHDRSSMQFGERMQLTTCQCFQAVVVDTPLVNTQVHTPSQVILSSD